MCPIRRHCPYTRTRCTRHTSQAILAHSFSRCTFREPLFNIRGQPVHKLDSDHDSGFPEGREANVIQLRYPAGREEIKDEYGLISEGQKDKEGSPHTHTHTHTHSENTNKKRKRCLRRSRDLSCCFPLFRSFAVCIERAVHGRFARSPCRKSSSHSRQSIPY